MNIIKEYHAPQAKVLINIKKQGEDGTTFCPVCKKFHPIDLYFERELLSGFKRVTSSPPKTLWTTTTSANIDFNYEAVNVKADPDKKEYEVIKIKSHAGRKHHLRFLNATCEVCGTTFTSEDGYDVDYIDRNYSCPPHSTLNHIYLLDDKNKKGQKVLNVLIISTLYTCWNDSVQYRKVGFKVIFNLETGQTYTKGIYDINTKQKINKKSSMYHTATYKGFQVGLNGSIGVYNLQLYEFIVDELIARKKEFCPYAVKPISRDDPASSIGIIQDLTLFNRMPSIDGKLFSRIVNMNYDRKDFYPEVRSISANTTDFYGDIFRLLGVKPNKTLRRYLLDGGDYTTLKILLKVFKKPDSIAKLSSAVFKKTHLKFLKAMVKAYGETNAANKIKDGMRKRGSNPFILGMGSSYIDSVNMWNSIRKYGGTYDFPKKATLKEIHDDLSIVERKIRRANQALKYRKSDLKKYQKETERFILRYAVDTHELIDVGDKMGICVGSYGERAAKKDCDILLIIDKTNNFFVTCIEKVNQNLPQIKACGNKKVEGELYAFIRDWLENTQLTAGYDWEVATENYEKKKTQYVHSGQKGSYFSNESLPTQEEYDAIRTEGFKYSITQTIAVPQPNRYMMNRYEIVEPDEDAEIRYDIGAL